MGIAFLSKRYKRSVKFIAYFQSFTNTYKPLDDVKMIYQSALSHPMISGLAISTRPDCVTPSILDYLAELNEKVPVFLEYGIESCYDKTLELINRGHKFEETVNAIQDTATRGLHVTGHLIFGLPGETRAMMLHEADVISSLPLNSLKFHQLQVINNTYLGQLYTNKPGDFYFFTMEEYISFIINFLERLNPKLSIERVASESPPQHRLNPGWGHKRIDWVQKKIESVMEFQDTWQGKKFKLN